MPADAAVNKPGHIRLTSHPPTTDAELLTIHWGARDTTERGPVVGTTTNRLHRNVIGTHSGSYGVYRALAVAANPAADEISVVRVTAQEARIEIEKSVAQRSARRNVGVNSLHAQIEFRHFRKMR